MKTRPSVLLLTTLTAALGCGLSSTAQPVIYQEGFNTDGEAGSPPRYTTLGRDVYEVDRLKAEVDPNTQQAGPV